MRYLTCLLLCPLKLVASPDSLLSNSARGFPVELIGVDALHAAFLNESRTRGRRLGTRTGNPGLALADHTHQCNILYQG